MTVRSRRRVAAVAAVLAVLLGGGAYYWWSAGPRSTLDRPTPPQLRCALPRERCRSLVDRASLLMRCGR